jgi:tetratricopeptide (TPR) repeat protein
MNHSLKYVIFILGSLFMTGCVSRDEDYFVRKDLNSAATGYKVCVEEEGSTGENACYCSFMLGKVLVDKNQFAEAIPYLKKAVDGASKSNCHTYGLGTAWFYWLGKAYFENRQYAEAIVYFDKAATIAAQNPATIMPAEATEWRKKYLSMIPPKSACYFWLGTAYYFNAQYQEAVGALKKAIDLDPTPIDFYTTLAGAYRQLKQYDEALGTVKRSIEIKPSDFAYGLLASIYETKKQFGQAVAARTKAIELNPKRAELYFNLAQTFEKEENYPEAINSYKKGLAIKPDDINGLFPLSTVHMALGQFQQAKDIADRVLSLMTRSGVGIQISTEGTYPVVRSVDSGPAQKTDIRAGDKIIRVDGKSIQGLSVQKVAETIKGADGTSVVLTIERKGLEKPLEKAVTREKILPKGAAAPLAVRSFAQRALGNPVSGREDAERAYAIDREDPWGWAQSAMSAAYIDQGKYNEALVILSKMKDNPFDRLLESLAYAKQKDMKKAVEIYTSLPEEYLASKNALRQSYKTALLESLRPYEDAQKASAKMFEGRGHYPEALTAYAEAVKVADEKEAQVIRTRVAGLLKKNPSLSELSEGARKYALRGEVLLKDGKLEGALKEFDSALKTAPFVPKLYYNTALIHGELKNYKKAIAYMNSYLDLFPDAPNARQVKDEIYKWQFKMENEGQ